MADKQFGGGIAVPAPAKVNLYLHVTGKRDDGYHLLDSLVAFAGIHDVVRVRPADDLSLEIDGPEAEGLAGEDDNLVLRAARALAQAAGVEPKAKLLLTKRLPIASGIGGGSADAAAALKGLSVLWDVRLSQAQMMEIALSLGADVPVCLSGKAVYMRGIGEELIPAPYLPKAWLVLINPRVALSTPSVFKARTSVFSKAAPMARAPADASDLAALLRERRNDLTEAAISMAPVIGEVLTEILEMPGCLLSRMSGSGATCFGLFATPGQATQAVMELARRRPEWWVKVAALETETVPDGQQDR